MGIIKYYVHYIIYVIGIFLALPAFGQLNVGKLSYDDGLSNSTVLSICRDSYGFLWIGTRDGLNRYDGIQIKQYRSDSDNVNTISTNNYIYSIVENPIDKTLWIGTQNGLNIYSPEKDDFKRIAYDHIISSTENHFAILSILFVGSKAYLGTNNGLAFVENSGNPIISEINLLKGKEIYSIYKNGQDYLLGTNEGLYFLNGLKQLRPIELNQAAAAFVRDIRRISPDKIWVATDNYGLFEIDNSYSLTQHYNDKNGLSSDFVRSIGIDKSGNIWIGTMEGLDFRAASNTSFRHIKSDLTNSFSLSDNSVKTIYVDQQNIVWIGTNFGGVNYYNPSVYNFSVDAADGKTHHLSGNLVSAIAVDDEGNTWVGTERDGLNIKKKGEDAYQKIPLRSNTIKSILIDDGFTYVGTFGAGLARINRKNTSDITYYDTSGKNGITLKQNYISAIGKDSFDNIWVGTGNSGVQILKNNLSEAIDINEQSSIPISNNYIKGILITKKGEVWIGTALGVNILRANDAQPQRAYKSDVPLGSYYINSLFEDANNDMWIGTQEKGLFRYNDKTNTLEKTALFPNINSYHVLGIAAGNKDELIVTTNKGIAIYHTITHQVTYKTIQDGLPTNQFLPNAILNHEGHILIGSYKGLIDMDISNQKVNTDIPRILVTDFSINGLGTEETNAVLGFRNPNVLDNISLKHDQNTFTIRFSSNNLINPLKNQFAYKIDGIDNQWNFTDKSFITYTNLAPGKYTLHLKTANNDGIWSTESSIIALSISPPFYKSTMAYLLYFLLAALIIYFIYKYNLDKRQLRTKLFYEEKHHRDQELLLQSKLDFFTRISHEIRTPLTLIYAPIDKILHNNKLESQVESHLHIASKNIRRLLSLMNELLTFSKLDANKLALKTKPIEPKGYFDNLYQSFLPIAEELNVDYVLENQLDSYFRADALQIEKVLVNILSNAFKFRADSAPKIKFQVLKNGDTVVIHVKDNGKGIKEEEKNKIFDNFYQGREGKAKEGWGIGLSLAKEIVDLHNGNIYINNASSFEGNYVTVFTVELTDSIVHAMQEDTVTLAQHPEYDHTSFVPYSPDNKEYSLLIVEDNDELREFLFNHLQINYEVSEAKDGLEALKCIAKNLPNIIITDIAMPNMDGYDLVKSLKSAPETAHVPIIMLTAKGEEYDYLKGYQYGIINYVTKPFNLNVLDLQIFNIITTIEHTKEQNRRYLFTDEMGIEVQGADSVYLDRLKSAIENNMADADFSVLVLSETMGQSQSSLLKKVKSLTGLSVAEMIKQIRLNRAAQLLIHADDVASVAYTVGFNDRKYFSKEFKKKFGVNPTQYREQNIH